MSSVARPQSKRTLTTTVFGRPIAATAFVLTLIVILAVPVIKATDEDPVMVDPAKGGAARRMVPAPAYQLDRHALVHPYGSVEILAEGEVEGHDWAIAVYRSRGGLWCLDFDGVDELRPTRSACSPSPDFAGYGDELGVIQASPIPSGHSVVIIGAASQRVEELVLSCKDGRHVLALLEPHQVEIESRFYAFMANFGACTQRVAFDATGAQIERENLYGSDHRERPSGSCQQGPWSENCPEAAWVRQFLVDAGFVIIGDTGSAIVGEQGKTDFYVWAHPEDGAPNLDGEGYEEIARLEGSLILRSDGLRFVWTTQSMRVWLEPGPTTEVLQRGLVRRIVLASALGTR